MVMPWISKGVKMIREEFVKLALAEQVNFSELCKRYAISRKTGYKWLARYEGAGVNGLEDQVKSPKTIPKKTELTLEKAVIEVRLKHNSWGGRKIRQYLLNHGYVKAPAPSTITDILHRYHLIEDGTNKSQKTWQRFEHESPNDLWQMDFKGHFAMADAKRCYPLTIVDDHSRFSIGISACLNEQGVSVKSALEKIFRRYGIPRRINVDNGNPWGSMFEVCRYTSFGLWLIDQGIELSHSAPHHPQTNGKNERFNRTLKTEVISNIYIKDVHHAQYVFDEWRHTYNFDRPHEALGYRVPGELYKPSYREYREKVEEYDYSEDYRRKVVDVRGRISIEGRTIFVGVPFAKRELGLRHGGDSGKYEVYYRHQKLGRFDLERIEKSSCVNLYSIID